jgi:hypothetical protein
MQDRRQKFQFQGSINQLAEESELNFMAARINSGASQINCKTLNDANRHHLK